MHFASGRDAAYLARVGRLDPGLLCPVVHRSESNQADLALVRSRDALVRSRANLVNHARGMVKVFGARLPMCSTTAFAKKAEEHLPASLRAALGPVVEVISVLTAQIQGLERKIEVLARESLRDSMLNGGSFVPEPRDRSRGAMDMRLAGTLQGDGYAVKVGSPPA